MKFLILLYFFMFAVILKMSLADDDICNLPPEVGMCRAALKRFYYDPATNECQQFIYGGCGGNGNNFENITDCENACIQIANGCNK